MTEQERNVLLNELRQQESQREKQIKRGAVPSSESLCKERGGGVCRFQPDGTVSAV